MGWPVGHAPQALQKQTKHPRQRGAWIHLWRQKPAPGSTDPVAAAEHRQALQAEPGSPPPYSWQRRKVTNWPAYEARAARLAGYADAYAGRHGVSRYGIALAIRSKLLERLHTDMNCAECQALMEEGAARSEQEAIATALVV